MAHDSPSSRLLRRDRSVMSRQRTGSHFQRQSNIAEPIGVAPDRPLNYGTCVPCLGSFYLAAWPPSPVGHVHHQCRRPSRTLAHLWQLLPTKTPPLPGCHCRDKAPVTHANSRALPGKNRDLPDRTRRPRISPPRRNNKTQHTYITTLTNNPCNLAHRELRVFAGNY